jgi:Ni/Co efflux regulator RcnB
MKKLVTCVLASAFLGACATAETTADTTPADAARNAPKEDFVTGSRLRRSDSAENYQGTTGTTREEWQKYRGPTTLDGR